MEYKTKKDLDVIVFPLESAVTKVLKKGRGRIEDGWGQGSYRRLQLDGGISYCTLGAIDYIDLNNVRVGPSEEAGKVLAAILDWGSGIDRQRLIGHLASWNDRPSRTKEEVLQVFDRAIVKSMECDNAI